MTHGTHGATRDWEMDNPNPIHSPARPCAPNRAEHTIPSAPLPIRKALAPQRISPK